jgi:hypothetical protein
MSYEGGCSCGHVRYRLKSEPMFVHCCHCLDCQNQTGGAFVLNALYETDRIELLQGELSKIEMPSPSGRGHDAYRCPKCQVAVWSDYGRRPYLRFVRVATLDQPHAIKPDAHIFTKSKVPWVKLPEGQRAFDVFYDMKTEWPAESLARRDAASAAAKS